MVITQGKVNKYVRDVLATGWHLEKGQLEAMVILHFDIPDKVAKEMVEAVNSNPQRKE